MRKKRSQTKRKLFDPDKIATAISQNLDRDLSSAHQMYGGGNSLQEFYSSVQRESTLKKYDPAVGNADELEKAAFKQFLSTNCRLREFNRNFRQPRDIPAKHLHPIELTLKRARALVHWVLRDIAWSELVEYASHSGGVTKGVKFSDTSWEAKFTYPMSTTRVVANLYNQYLRENKQFAFAVEDLNRRQIVSERFDYTRSSRATTVPKSSDKRRMIAIEPTLNMFFQQALMTVMYQRLKDVDLDVESLPFRHKQLAWQGSVSGKLATIDFSSASDCVSIELLRYLLPPRWFRYVTMFRCPSMEILGSTVKLEMVSTMGNAGTFPLETLVFWALGVATVMQRTRTNPNSLLSLPEERDLVSVFGDDCILPTVDAEAFMANAEAVGFVVNKEKSFYDDMPGFRESCGGDYLRGSNVRPVCIKAPTSTRVSALEPWLYTILNSLQTKYISYFGELRYVYDQQAFEYIFALFRKYKLKVKLVPPDFPEDSGFQTGDWRRFDACYDIPWDKVHTSDQGWAHFRYCRFVYDDRRRRHDPLRYTMWLRRPIIRNEWWAPEKLVQKELFPLRKRGGYVVAKALRPFWA